MSALAFKNLYWSTQYYCSAMLIICLNAAKQQKQQKKLFVRSSAYLIPDPCLYFELLPCCQLLIWYSFLALITKIILYGFTHCHTVAGILIISSKDVTLYSPWHQVLFPCQHCHLLSCYTISYWQWTPSLACFLFSRYTDKTLWQACYHPSCHLLLFIWDSVHKALMWTRSVLI